MLNKVLTMNEKDLKWPWSYIKIGGCQTNSAQWGVGVRRSHMTQRREPSGSLGQVTHGTATTSNPTDTAAEQSELVAQPPRPGEARSFAPQAKFLGLYFTPKLNLEGW